MALGKGLDGVEVGGGNQSFSVLKHKPKVGVDAIFCMILTTLLNIYQYTLFFQPNLSLNKSSKKSNVGRFYGVTQGHLSYEIMETQVYYNTIWFYTFLEHIFVFFLCKVQGV